MRILLYSWQAPIESKWDSFSVINYYHISLISDIHIRYIIIINKRLRKENSYLEFNWNWLIWITTTIATENLKSINLFLSSSSSLFTAINGRGKWVFLKRIKLQWGNTSQEWLISPQKTLFIFGIPGLWKTERRGKYIGSFSGAQRCSSAPCWTR